MLAEDAVAMDHRRAGHHVLATRARMPSGELDLVTLEGDVVVFTEIKQRKTLDEAAHAITPRQIARIGRAAQEWLIAEDRLGADIRFDAALVDQHGRRKHLTNALDFTVH